MEMKLKNNKWPRTVFALIVVSFIMVGMLSSCNYSKPIRILILGDSIGAGAGTDNSEDKCFNILKTHLEGVSEKDVIIENPSLGANTSYAAYCMANRIPNSLKFDYVFVCMGANDSETDFNLYYESIFIVVRERFGNVPIISIIENSLFDQNEKRTVIEEVSNHYKAKVMDMAKAFSNGEYSYGELCEDGTHPNTLGHKLYSDSAIHIIEELNNIKEIDADDIATLSDDLGYWKEFEYFDMSELKKISDLEYEIPTNPGKYLFGIHLMIPNGENYVQAIEDNRVFAERKWDFTGNPIEFYQVLGRNETLETVTIRFSSIEVVEAMKGVVLTRLMN